MQQLPLCHGSWTPQNSKSCMTGHTRSIRCMLTSMASMSRSARNRPVWRDLLRNTLSMYFKIPVEVVSEHGLTWLDNASVSIRSVEFRVRGPAPASVKSAAIQLNKFSCKAPGWGRNDVLRQSAPSMQELVAPLLIEGKLHLEMVVSGVDLPV